MDLGDSVEEAAFRSRLRAWLAQNVPSEPEPRSMAERWEYMRSFQRKLYLGGWVALSYPTEFGGQGLGPVEEAILSEELGRANSPTLLPLGHLGRPFLSHASDEQRSRYLPPLLGVEEIWCQGFSEPDAGSDLANVSTRARKEGRGFRISGRKVWTSYGAFADFCLLLARTEEGSKRHHGMSAFILPLRIDGVTVRPLVMANGDEEFAEITLDDVYLPDENVIGAVGQGWEVAMATIEHERGAVDTGYLPKFERFFAEVVSEARGRSDALSDSVEEKLGRVAAGLEVMRMHTLRNLSRKARGEQIGPLSSIDKLLMTRVEQDLLGVAIELAPDRSAPSCAVWFDRYIYGRAGSIYGGSSQIQRNILAQRVLGLPR